MKYGRSPRFVCCLLAALLVFGSCASGSGEGEEGGLRRVRARIRPVP